MKYSHHYAKLDLDHYTTIRRYSKGKVGEAKTETYPGGYHFAVIESIERKTFNQIPLELLLPDTDCVDRDQAFKLIQSFYPKPIDRNKEKLFIYYMRRC